MLESIRVSAVTEVRAFDSKGLRLFDRIDGVTSIGFRGSRWLFSRMTCLKPHP